MTRIYRHPDQQTIGAKLPQVFIADNAREEDIAQALRDAAPDGIFRRYGGKILLHDQSHNNDANWWYRWMKLCRKVKPKAEFGIYGWPRTTASGTIKHIAEKNEDAWKFVALVDFCVCHLAPHWLDGQNWIDSLTVARNNLAWQRGFLKPVLAHTRLTIHDSRPDTAHTVLDPARTVEWIGNILSMQPESLYVWQTWAHVARTRALPTTHQHYDPLLVQNLYVPPSMTPEAYERVMLDYSESMIRAARRAA